MGNSCQAPPPLVSQVMSRDQFHLHKPFHCKAEVIDCILSPHSACCVDDDNTEACEYQRLEADCGHGYAHELPDSRRVSAPLPPSRAEQPSRGALEAISSQMSTAKVVSQLEPPRALQRSKQVRCISPMPDEPAAPTRARDDDEKDKLPPCAPRIFPKLLPSLKRAHSASSSRTGAHVYVHLYDLSDAFAQLNSVALDLLGYGGALHVGVEVFSVEWSFGTGGVSVSMPKSNRYYAYRQTLPMGRTTFSRDEVEHTIVDMHKEWSGSEYDLFSKNCGTFCNALCIRLGVGSLPAWVTRLAEDGARSQTVRRLADMMMRTGLIGDGASSCQTTPQASQTTSRIESMSNWGSPAIHGGLDDGSLVLPSPRGEDLLEEFMPGITSSMLLRSLSASVSTCSTPPRKGVTAYSLKRDAIPSPVRRAAAVGGG